MSDPATRSSEELLLEFGRTGDPSLFTELVHRHRRPVLRRCLRLLHDLAEAEEVAQETFRRAFQHAATFRGGKAEAWLVKIASNLSINRMHDWTRERTAAATLIALPDPRDPHYSSTEIQLQVQAVLNKLEPRQKIVLKLLYFQRFTYQEIAEHTKWREGAVRSYAQNGRIQFAKWWNGRTGT